MSSHSSVHATVTLRVHRFTPRPARERKHSSSPFGKRASSPFGGNSNRVRGKQWVQEYRLLVHPEDTLLDCLLTIKRDIDPTLAFRYSCGHGICGSDAVAVNGTPTLLCSAQVGQWVQRLPDVDYHDDEGFRKTGDVDADDDANALEKDTEQAIAEGDDLGVIEIAALPGFPVKRDLIADIDPMLEQIRELKPYLIHDGALGTKADGRIDVFEYLQNPEQLAKYELLSNCIACGVCEGACPVYAGGEAFVGPAALINQARFINDSRDTATQERLDALDTADGIQACQSVRACSRECPRGIDVGEEIWQLIAQVKER